MDAIHRLLAFAAAGATVVGFVWTLGVALRSQSGGSRFERFQAAVVSLFVVGAASGLLLLVGGARPADGLHLMYALIAIAMIPIARSFLGRTNSRGATVLLLVAFVVLGALTFRLFTTG